MSLFHIPSDSEGTLQVARKVAKRYFYVYILVSLSGTLYVGVTDDLPLRMHQHREGAYDGFTKKYKINRLMYFEVCQDQKYAAFREQQIKKYRREKKVVLIEKDNAKWQDLSLDLYSLKRVPSPRLRTSMEDQ